MTLSTENRAQAGSPVPLSLPHRTRLHRIAHGEHWGHLKHLVHMMALGLFALFLLVVLLSVFAGLAAEPAHSTDSADYSYAINSSSLPFITTEMIGLNGSGNVTVSLTYDDFLNGPAEAILIDGIGSIQVNVSIPDGTENGTYQRLLEQDNTTIRVFEFVVLAPPSLQLNLSNETNQTGNLTGNETGNFTGNITGNETGNASNQTGNQSNITLPTPDPVLSVFTDKALYNLGDAGQMIINLTPQGNVTISICPNQTGWVQCYPQIFIPSQPFPLVWPLPTMNRSQSFIIDATGRVLNKTVHSITGYSVQNSLSAQIGGDRKLDIDETTTLTAAAAGGIAPYTYTWTLANNTVITGQNIIITYSGEGTYTERVTVTDAAGNSVSQSIDVVVRRTYAGRVRVFDNETYAPIENALVRFDSSHEEYTGTNGEAAFELYKDTYELTVQRSGYRTLSRSQAVAGTFTFDYYLQKSSSQGTGGSPSQGSAAAQSQVREVVGIAPTITLDTVAGSIFRNGTVELTFHMEDDNPTQCSVLLAAKGDSWYRTIRTFTPISSGESYSAGVANLDDSAYQWRVECLDASGNLASTTPSPFTVDSKATDLTPLEEGAPYELTGSDSEFASRIETEEQKLPDLPFEEKQAADALDLASIMQDAVKRLEWARRDLSALEFRKDLTLDERTAEERRIERRIEDIKRDTPVSLTVTDSKRYVKYASDQEIESFLATYATLPPERKLPGPALDRRTLFEGTKLTQHALTVSTSAFTIDLITVSGGKIPMTLLVRDVKLEGDENLTDKIAKHKVALIEHIPKGLAGSDADNASNYLYASTATILSEDPLVEFSLAEPRIVYAIPGRIGVEATEGINTLLYDPDPPRVGNDITGGVIGTFMTALGPRAYLYALVIFVALVYVLYVFNLPGRIAALYVRIFHDKQVGVVNALVNDALDYLDADDIERAELIYREVRLSYENLNTSSKMHTYSFARDLCGKLDLAYLDMLLEKLKSAIRVGSGSAEVAEKIYGTYVRLTPDQRRKRRDETQEALRTVNPDAVLPPVDAPASSGDQA